MNAHNPTQAIQVENPVKTYGQLKLELIQKGVVLPQELLARQEVAAGVCPGQPGEEIALALAENFIAKVKLKDPQDGRIRLGVQKDALVLDPGNEEVGVVPLPEFLKKQMNERTPVSENICLDGYCLNVFLRAMDKGARLSMDLNTILAVVESAFEEGAADLLQLNMDDTQDRDRGFQLLAPVIAAIKKKFKTFVALKGFPPKDKQVIDFMYASGIDLLDFPLGGFAGSDPTGDIHPEHRVHDALEYAVGIFPPGTVWTELVLGADPLEMVKKRIDYICERGVLPQLRLMPSSMHTGKDYWRVKEVVRHMQQTVLARKIPLKWLYPNCRSVSPLDAGFFIEPPEKAGLAAKPVYRSRLSKKASEGFAAFRRKLRIKNVSDSYESAGL